MRKLKNKFLAFLLLSAAAVSATAETQPALVVEMRSGENVAFCFEECPKIRFVDDSLVVNTNLYQFSYAASAVQRYVFGTADPSAINAPTAGGDIINGDQLTLNLGKAGATASVYAADGRVALSATAGNDGTVNLSLASLPTGVYLVKSDSFSTKILKR